MPPGGGAPLPMGGGPEVMETLRGGGDACEIYTWDVHCIAPGGCRAPAPRAPTMRHRGRAASASAMGQRY